MKKLFIVITLFSFIISCGKKLVKTEENFFDPKNLSWLSLEDVGNFWNDDSIKHISDYTGAIF